MTDTGYHINGASYHTSLYKLIFIKRNNSKGKGLGMAWQRCNHGGHLTYIKVMMLVGVMMPIMGWSAPVAGSQITNIASGDFIDAMGNIQSIDSNPVSLTIQQVYALSLSTNQQQVGNIGANISFAHLLKNTVNIPDKYQLKLTQAGSGIDDFDLSNVAIYTDRDQNGLPDDNVNLLSDGASIAL